jgi:hypothetical protein
MNTAISVINENTHIKMCSKADPCGILNLSVHKWKGSRNAKRILSIRQIQKYKNNIVYSSNPEIQKNIVYSSNPEIQKEYCLFVKFRNTKRILSISQIQKYKKNIVY